MSKETSPITIKKYANRRLYNTGTSTYVTLEDLAVMVKDGDEFVVVDAKSGDDITRSVLTQIIFEQEGKGTNLLPITFLRQLIRFYGDSMQALVPSYLDMSIASLTKEKGKLSSQMGAAFGGMPFGGSMEEQVRANMAMFEKAFRVFSPFPGAGGAASADETPAETGSEIDDLKKEIAAMKDKIDKLGSPR